MLNELPKLPPIRKSSAKNYTVVDNNVDTEGFSVPGMIESSEDRHLQIRPKTTERRTNIGLIRNALRFVIQNSWKMKLFEISF